MKSRRHRRNVTTRKTTSASRAINPISAQVGARILASLFSARRIILASTTLTTTMWLRESPSLLQATNKLVIRAGYGIFYVPSFYGQGPNDGFSQATPWTTSL